MKFSLPGASQTFKNMKLKSSEKCSRSLVKAISWRVTGTLDTIFISFLITGNINFAVTIGSVEILTKVFLYFFHERIWSYINFGRKDEDIVEVKSEYKKY
jgi:uncharacterized membrane protein